VCCVWSRHDDLNAQGCLVRTRGRTYESVAHVYVDLAKLEDRVCAENPQRFRENLGALPGPILGRSQELTHLVGGGHPHHRHGIFAQLDCCRHHLLFYGLQNAMAFALTVCFRLMELSFRIYISCGYSPFVRDLLSIHLFLLTLLVDLLLHIRLVWVTVMMDLVDFPDLLEKG
jgi:hypothetical protein